MTKQKYSKLISVLLSLGFFAFLAVLSIATLLRKPELFSYYENRNLSTLPDITSEGMADGSCFSDIDTYFKEHAAGRATLLKLNTYIDMNVFDRPVVNDTVIADGMLLPYNDYEQVDTDDINEKADVIAGNLKEHSDTVRSYDGEFYYIAVPCQYVCREDSYPSYLNNRGEYTEASSSALFSRLDKLDVNYIDMLEYYEQNGRPESFTSTVDNHYSIYGAYATYTELMNRITEDTDCEPDILEEGEYTVTEVQNEYLGSRERKLFGMWDSGESLSIITPKEYIPFTRSDYGGMRESSVYALPQNDSDDVLYKLYMDGDIGSTVIETDRDELPDILIYGDSFTNPVECIAWYSFDTMYSLDYRMYDAMTVDEFVKKYKPDIVVCIRDYEAMLSAQDNGQ